MGKVWQRLKHPGEVGCVVQEVLVLRCQSRGEKFFHAFFFSSVGRKFSWLPPLGGYSISFSGWAMSEAKAFGGVSNAKLFSIVFKVDG